MTIPHATRPPWHLAALIATTGIHGASAQALAPEELFDAAIGRLQPRRPGPILAVLAQSDTDNGDTSLYIFISREDAEDGVLDAPILGRKEMLWGSGGSRRFLWPGTLAQKALDNGSLAITEQNWGGRPRTVGPRPPPIALARPNASLLPATHYNSFDTLQEDEPLNCDLNLLTGTRRPLTTGPSAFPPAPSP